MAVEKMVLVVSPTPSVAQAAASSARQCGYTPVVVRSFPEAKKYLHAVPHLLVTELKLADYNGLHLALRARMNDVPSIVIADASFEHEIEQHGAVWVSPTMASTELPAVMIGLVQGPLAGDAAYGWHDSTTGTEGASDWHPPTIHH